MCRNEEADIRYKHAYEKVVLAARSIVADRKNVFTHNPWGDYGHEDHLLVYKALKNLQAEFDYAIWFSNYSSNRSVHLMNNYISGFRSDYECLPTNKALSQEIVELYRKYECWTWYADYQWFDRECLMRDIPVSDQSQLLPYGHNFPINYLKMTVQTKESKKKSRSFANIAGKITGKLKKS